MSRRATFVVSTDSWTSFLYHNLAHLQKGLAIRLTNSLKSRSKTSRSEPVIKKTLRWRRDSPSWVPTPTPSSNLAYLQLPENDLRTHHPKERQRGERKKTKQKSFWSIHYPSLQSTISRPTTPLLCYPTICGKTYFRIYLFPTSLRSRVQVSKWMQTPC